MPEPRIRQPKKYDELFKTLIDDKDNSVFTSKAQVLLFAAAIGFNEGKRTPFKDQDSLEPIRMATFENLGQNFQIVLNTLAVAETKDIKILSPEKSDELILIFEEYACTGLEVLKNRLKSQHSQLDAIITMLSEQQAQGEKVEDDVLSYFQ